MLSDFWNRIKKIFLPISSMKPLDGYAFPGIANANRYKKAGEREAYVQGYKEGYLQGMLKQQSLYQ